MLDALNRAKRYRELAKGCRRLAAIGFSSETRDHFLRMAERYGTWLRPRRLRRLGASQLAASPAQA
jgi:hypothetical protein